MAASVIERLVELACGTNLPPWRVTRVLEMSQVPTPAPGAECPVKCSSRTHLSDDALLRDLATATARERGATAEVLALIAEVDDRKLYLPAGYASMYAYCVGELHLSEDAACKR